jgi:nitrate/nitrite transport system ATP-binding protein
MAFVELSKIMKGYGKAPARSEVLRDVNLEIEQGEFVAIVGFSGAGKTTLVSLIAGLTLPDEGTVTVGGKPVTGPGTDRGVVFQNYSLLPWLTAHANIALAVDQAFPQASQEERTARVERYLSLVGLGAAGHKRPRELSGGMRQRVALARALAMDPGVLLLDEPLGAVDALTRGTLQNEIARIWQADKKTMLLITNDVEEGILLADRIIPLSAGPHATLGPSVVVDLERPRDRRELVRDPRFRAIRTQVVDWLLDSAKRRRLERAAPPPSVMASPQVAEVGA